VLSTAAAVTTARAAARSSGTRRRAAARSGTDSSTLAEGARDERCAYRKVSRRKRFPPRVSVRWKAPAVLFKKELVAALSSPLSSDSAVFRAARSGELRLHSISDTSSKPLLGERALITPRQRGSRQRSGCSHSLRQRRREEGSGAPNARPYSSTPCGRVGLLLAPHGHAWASLVVASFSDNRVPHAHRIREVLAAAAVPSPPDRSMCLEAYRHRHKFAPPHQGHILYRNMPLPGLAPSCASLEAADSQQPICIAGIKFPQKAASR
jgi:hypothetical protein